MVKVRGQLIQVEKTRGSCWHNSKARCHGSRSPQKRPATLSRHAAKLAEGVSGERWPHSTVSSRQARLRSSSASGNCPSEPGGTCSQKLRHNLRRQMSATRMIYDDGTPARQACPAGSMSLMLRSMCCCQCGVSLTFAVPLRAVDLDSTCRTGGKFKPHCSLRISDCKADLNIHRCPSTVPAKHIAPAFRRPGRLN